MCFLGQTENGIYTDEWEGVNPEHLQEFYGVNCHPASRRSHGAGNPLDESDNDSEHSGPSAISIDEAEEDDIDWEDIEEKIADGIAENFHDEPVPVPPNSVPFQGDEGLNLYRQGLQYLRDQNILPTGFGITEDELEEEGYPALGFIPGRRRGHQLQVLLPIGIWKPRAEKWVQALHTMILIQNLEENNMDVDGS